MRSSEEETPVDSRWIELRVESGQIPRRTNHAAAIGSAVLYVYGGYDMEHGMLDDFYSMALNQKKYVWRVMPVEGKHRPGRRRNHTLCCDASTIYLHGGQINGTDSCNSLHRYSLAKGSWERAEKLRMPCVDSHNSFLHEGKLVVYGGYLAESATHSGEIYEYDLVTRQTKCLEPEGKRPAGRSNFSLSLIQNTFYIFGGENGCILNDMWCFNLGTHSWREILSTTTLWPEPRRGHSCVAHNDHLFLFGGIQSITRQRNDIYIFELAKQRWVKVQDNGNDTYKLAHNKMHTEEGSTSSPQRRSNRNYKQRKTGCRFNLTISSFGGIDRNPYCQFAETSLYRRRGEPEVFSAVVRSKSTMVESNRRRDFKIRKERMLSEFNVEAVLPERKLSPISEAMKFSLKAMGAQHSRSISPEKRQLRIPAIRYDASRSFLLGKKPCARDGQTACVYRDYMVLFGGDRHMMSFNDIFLFRMDKALRSLR